MQGLEVEVEWHKVSGSYISGGQPPDCATESIADGHDEAGRNVSDGGGGSCKQETATDKENQEHMHVTGTSTETHSRLSGLLGNFVQRGQFTDYNKSDECYDKAGRGSPNTRG